MKSVRRFVLAFVSAVFVLSGCSGGNQAGLTPAAGANGSFSADTLSRKYVKHVVILVQENRSFDNFFATFPGADGATFGYTHKGKKIMLVKSPLASADINHDWKTFLAECDLQGSTCKMDGFDLAKIGGGNPGGNYAYRYVDPAQIQQYWTIAQQYALLDHMFQTQGSGSFTAHQDLIAGGTAIDSTNSLVDYPNESADWGCDAPAGTITSLITVDDIFKQWKGPFPCLNYPTGTMRDLLDAKKVSWKYYSPLYHPKQGGAGALWNAFAAIDAVRNGPEWTTNISMPQTNICKDIDSGTLPAVSWVIPDQLDSDHPQSKNQIDTGPDWIAAVVNKIGQSSYWNSTAVVIVWDDWGGFFDNVAPKQYASGELGFRVPAMVVSPYINAGTISHTPFEFGSILKFVEQTFGLGSLHTSDVRAASIGSIFSFKKPARTFSAIPTKDSCDYFIKRPPSYQPVDTE
ncbi:MAG TPA: alkaline phosphatase family protein [Candidatus Tumulicola sp.]